MKKLKFIVSFILITNILFSQQIPDTLYIPSIENSAYKNKKGPIIYIDEFHNNFHTKDNRFLPFARLLRQDGYIVNGFQHKFSESHLKSIQFLVISNALAEGSSAPFTIPTKGAFSQNEITNLRNWVKNGGSLFLIADHMPFAGAASELGKAFGFKFYDSFLFDNTQNGIIEFSRENSMLNSNFITNGRNKSESVNKIKTFTGQAFKIPKKAISILTIKKDFMVYLPDTMWVFNNNTKKFNADKLSQGAVLEYGKGRIAVFGEAAMFTAQLAGRNKFKVGMNSKQAPENYKLLLNIIHWLDRLY